MHRRFTYVTQQLAELDPDALKSIEHDIAIRRFRSSTPVRLAHYTITLAMLLFLCIADFNAATALVALAAGYCLAFSLISIRQLFKGFIQNRETT